MKQEGMELVAKIVESNVDQAAATANTLIEHEKRKVRWLAMALRRLDEAIAASPFVDRRVERVRASYAVTWGLEIASHELEGGDESGED